MLVRQPVVATLRLFLCALFAILVVFQTMSLPGQFASMAKESPDDAYLRWPMTALSVFWVLCIEIVVVATWKLLTLVTRDRIFTDGSLTWVDAIVAAIGVGWASLAAFTVYAGIRATDPALPLILLLLLTGIGVVGLLMLVLRALLRQATTLQTDLEGVV